MATIAGLNVILTASTSGFRSAISMAMGSLSSLSNAAMAVGRKLTSLPSLIAGAGMTYLAKKAMDSIDAMGKFADSIGISVEALQELQYVAGLSGVGSEQFNKSMQRMILSIGDLSKGTGVAKEAFDKLGISYSDLERLGAEDQFMLVAERLIGITDQTEKVKVAYDIFGKSGVGVLNMMKDGIDAMKASMEEASSLGLVLDRSQVLNVEMANDAMSKMRQSSQRIVELFAVELAPILVLVSNKITEFTSALAKGSGGFFRGLIIAGVTKLIGLFGTLREIFLRLVDLLAAIAKGLSQITVGSASKALSDVSDSLREFIGEIRFADIMLMKDTGMTWAQSMQRGFMMSYNKLMAQSKEAAAKIVKDFTKAQPVDISWLVDQIGDSFDAAMSGIGAMFMNGMDRAEAGARSFAKLLDGIKAKADVLEFVKSDEQKKMDEFNKRLEEMRQKVVAGGLEGQTGIMEAVRSRLSEEVFGAPEKPDMKTVGSFGQFDFSRVDTDSLAKQGEQVAIERKQLQTLGKIERTLGAIEMNTKNNYAVAQ